MKLGIFQFAPIWGNKDENLKKIEDTIASYSSIDLWILPELCTTGYQFSSKDEIEELAEEFPLGKSSQCSFCQSHPLPCTQEFLRRPGSR